MAYDTQAPQDQGTPALRPGFSWVESDLLYFGADGDHEIVDQGEAEDRVRELLGSDRQVQRVDLAGGWLVEFTEEEWHELKTSGWFGRENDECSIEAEMP